ncbi:Zinc finger protein MAGPIE, partial [Frankliniella fusca]
LKYKTLLIFNVQADLAFSTTKHSKSHSFPWKKKRRTRLEIRNTKSAFYHSAQQSRPHSTQLALQCCRYIMSENNPY